MKFSVIATALVSAVLVSASDVYHFEFEDATIASNCLTKNAAYINKVSKEYSLVEADLKMTLKNGCNPVIADNINYVCGGVKSSSCS